MLILCPTLSQATDEPIVWDWVRSEDGQSVTLHGQGVAEGLRAHGECVLVLPPTAVRWHYLTLPAHPASKRTAVLRSLLEDATLGDIDDIHPILNQAPIPGQGQWCAVASRSFMRACLEDLQAAGVTPARIIPMLSPQDQTTAWVWSHQDSWLLSICDAHGVSHWSPQQASWPQALLGAADLSTWSVRCPSHLAQHIESQWPQVRPTIRSVANWLLACCQSDWDFAQGEYKVHPAQRYVQALARATTALRYADAWRPTRWGLGICLLGIGLAPPIAAWQSEQRVQAWQAQSRALVTQAFPEVRLVIDPLLQMQRSMDQLAAQKGLRSGPQLAAAIGALGQINQLRVARLESKNGQVWRVQLYQRADATAVNRALKSVGWRGQPVGNTAWDIQPATGEAS